MELYSAINQYFIQFGAGLALLMALSNLLVRRRGSLREGIFWIGIVLGLIQARIGFFLAGANTIYPILGIFQFALIFSSGPLVLILAMQMVAFVDRPRRSLRLHFIPAVLVALAEVMNQILVSDSDRVALLQGVRSGPVNWNRIDVMTALSSLHVLGYLGYLLLLYYRIFRKDFIIAYTRPALTLFSVPFFATLLWAVGYFTRSVWALHLSGDLYTILVILAFIFSLRYPNFFVTLRAEIQKNRYERTQLTGIDLDDVRVKLADLMKKDKVFLDPELRLADLSETLRVSPHQLSRILNEFYGKNFNEFVNEYRIDHAKKLLVKEPERTVISVAFEVGFNTKSAFNAQFLKIAGMNPLQFRKKATE